jgi:hypothetical protein
MPFADSARLSTWAIVLGAALAGDGLYVGSSTLLVAGTAVVLPALLVARSERRADRRKRGQSVPLIAARFAPLGGHARNVADVEVYRWENEGGAARTT